MTMQRRSQIAALCAIWLMAGAALVRAEEDAQRQEQALRSKSISSRRALILEARASARRASDFEVESVVADLWERMYALRNVCGAPKPALIVADTILMTLVAESVDDDLLWDTWIYALGDLCGVAEPALLVVETSLMFLDPHKPSLPLDPEFPDAMVVATVNSEPITVQEVLERYSVYFETPKVGLEDTEARQEAAEKEREKRSLFVRIGLQKVIERKLKIIGLKARLNQREFDKLEKELELRWTEFASRVTAKPGVDRKERDRDLALMKRIFLEGLMADRFDSDLDSKTDEPTSRELRDYYEDHIDEWAYPAGVKWQEISVLCGSDEPPADAEARARGLLAQLQAGADFSELARKHSEGITRGKGGFRDWTPAGAFGCQEDEDFLFSARIGETSQVIHGRDEFHIVRLVDRREAGHRSYGEVKPKIREALRHRAFSRLSRETMEKLLKDAEIVTAFGDGWEFDLPRVDLPRVD